MTPIFFLVVFSLGCLLTLFRNPIFGIYTYLFTFYMSPSHNWWGDEVPELRYLFIVGIVTLISSLIYKDTSNRLNWLKLAPSKILLSLVCYMWIQYFWAIDVDVHLDGTITFTKHLVIYYLIYKLVNTREKINTFLLVHIVGCFWFGYLALDASGGRLESIGGPVGGSNELGIHVSTALIIGGMMWMLSTGWIRILILVCLPFIANTLILTISRGAFLGFLAGGFTAGIFVPGQYRRKFMLLAALAIVLMSLLMHDQLIERFTETWKSFTSDEVEVDRSAASRVEIFKAGIRIGVDHPMGSGYRGTALLSPYYMDKSLLNDDSGQRSAHNTVAAVFAEHGYIGISLYFALIIWVLKTVFFIKRLNEDEMASNDRTLAVAVISALIGMYVSGNFSNDFFTETQYWLLAILCSLLEENRRTINSEDRQINGNKGQPKVA